MNKLVSKRPILRFKQGKKIIKAYNGVPLQYRNGKWYTYSNGEATYITPEKTGTIGGKQAAKIGGTWYDIKDGIVHKVLFKQGPKSKSGGGSGNRTTGTSFKSAFDTARNAGQQFFTWNNRKFTTQNKGEENYLFQNGKWVDPNSVITFTPPTEEAMAQIGNKVLQNNETAAQPTVPSSNNVQPVYSDEQIAELKNLVPEDNSYIYTPKQYEPSYTPRQYKPIYTYVPYTEQQLKNAFTPQTFTLFSKKGGSLTSRNPIKRFKLNFR